MTSGVRSAPALSRKSYSQAQWFEPKWARSEEHTSELQSPCNIVSRLLLEKKISLRPHLRLTRLSVLPACYGASLLTLTMRAISMLDFSLTTPDPKILPSLWSHYRPAIPV